MQKERSATKQVWREHASNIALNYDDLAMFMSKRTLSIAEYMNTYIEDLDIVLDDELSFPQPPSKSKYLEYFDEGI
jgi:hypothetical protein